MFYVCHEKKYKKYEIIVNIISQARYLALAVVPLLCLALSACHTNAKQKNKAITAQKQKIIQIRKEITQTRSRLNKAKSQEGTLHRWFHDTHKVNMLQKKVANEKKNLKKARNNLHSLSGNNGNKHSMFFYFLTGVFAIATIIIMIGLLAAGGYIALLALSIFIIFILISGIGWLSTITI